MPNPRQAPDCERVLRHLKRIQGQISALEEYVSEQRPCEDVAHLLKSITTSFASVRSEIVEEMIVRELAAETLSSSDRVRLHSIVSVLQK